ncbi:sugar ABC transporter substrate-binding protein [soil metagenome]
MADHRTSTFKRRTLLTGVPAAGAAAFISPAWASRESSLKFAYFADSAELAVYQKLVRAFQDQNPGITVEQVAITSANVSPNGQQMPASAYPDWLFSSFTRPNPPDVFFLNYREVDLYASRGVLEPLDDYVSSSTELHDEEFFPEVLDAFRSEDYLDSQLGALPQNISSLVVYYNTELFDKNNISRPADGWSWLDFQRVAKRLTSDSDADGRVDIYGVALDPSLHRFAAAIWGAGGELFDHHKRPTKMLLDTPQAREGLEWMTSLGPRGLGVVPPRWEQMALDDTHRFRSGRAAMLVQSRRVVPFLREEPELSFDVAPLPIGKTPANVLHSDGLGMWKGSLNKELAWKFIEFALGRPGQTILSESGRVVPSLRSVAASDAFLKGSALGSTIGYSQQPVSSLVFLDNIAHARPLPGSNVWPSGVWQLESALRRAFYEDGDVVTAIKDAVDRSTMDFQNPDDLVRHIYPTKPLESED